LHQLKEVLHLGTEGLLLLEALSLREALWRPG